MVDRYDPEHPAFAGGGVREDATGKPRFDLLLPLGVPFDQQFLTRCAAHLTLSCQKYPARNWEEFSDLAALDRCRASAMRHMIAWMAEEDDEDHAAAVFFNLMAAEHVRAKLEGRIPDA